MVSGSTSWHMHRCLNTAQWSTVMTNNLNIINFLVFEFYGISTPSKEVFKYLFEIMRSNTHANDAEDWTARNWTL